MVREDAAPAFGEFFQSQFSTAAEFFRRRLYPSAVLYAVKVQKDLFLGFYVFVEIAPGPTEPVGDRSQ